VQLKTKLPARRRRATKRSSPENDYTPAEGRLAAAMATISARRRPIRDGAERNNELIRRISQLPSAPAETSIP
jgi:hypothetical protein